MTDDSQGQWQHWRREEVSRWSSREWTHRPPCWSRSRKWWTAAYLWLRPVKYNKNTHADTKTSAFISFWDEMAFWKTHHVLEVPVHNSSHLKECLNPKLKTQQYYIETSTFTRPLWESLWRHWKVQFPFNKKKPPEQPGFREGRPSVITSSNRWTMLFLDCTFQTCSYIRIHRCVWVLSLCAKGSLWHMMIWVTAYSNFTALWQSKWKFKKEPSLNSYSSPMLWWWM